MGRRGSPRAHTLGKRSHGVQDHYKIGPGAQNSLTNIKNNDFIKIGVGGMAEPFNYKYRKLL